MGAQKGNKHAMGNKGGGRKSLRVEMAQFQDLLDAYYSERDIKELEKRIKSKKFSVRDRHILSMLEGDSVAINALLKKIYPDKMEWDDPQGRKELEKMTADIKSWFKNDK